MRALFSMIAKRYGVTAPGQDDDVARVSVRHMAPLVASSEFGERKRARNAPSTSKTMRWTIHALVNALD